MTAIVAGEAHKAHHLWRDELVQADVGRRRRSPGEINDLAAYAARVAFRGAGDAATLFWNSAVPSELLDGDGSHSAGYVVTAVRHRLCRWFVE